MVLWINNIVYVGVGQIDPSWSRSMPERLKQWPRSWGIYSDSHPKRVHNSGSATTVLQTKYLYNDAKPLFLSERWVFFKTLIHLICFDHMTQTWSNRPIIIKKNVLLGLLPCRVVVTWDYTLVVPRLLTFPWKASPILNELKKQ